MTSKAKCVRCEQHKHPSEFSRCKRNKSGLQSYCRVCASLAQREWRAKHWDSTNSCNLGIRISKGTRLRLHKKCQALNIPASTFVRLLISNALEDD